MKQIIVMNNLVIKNKISRSSLSYANNTKSYKKINKNANNCFAHPLRRVEVETEWKTTLILE